MRCGLHIALLCLLLPAVAHAGPLHGGVEAGLAGRWIALDGDPSNDVSGDVLGAGANASGWLQRSLTPHVALHAELTAGIYSGFFGGYEYGTTSRDGFRSVELSAGVRLQRNSKFLRPALVASRYSDADASFWSLGAILAIGVEEPFDHGTLGAEASVGVTRLLEENLSPTGQELRGSLNPSFGFRFFVRCDFASGGANPWRPRPREQPTSLVAQRVDRETGQP